LRPVAAAVATARGPCVNATGARAKPPRAPSGTADTAFRFRKNRDSLAAAVYPAVTLSAIRPGEPGKTANNNAAGLRGLRCRSEDLRRDPAIALQEFHGVAVGILDENSANSEI